VKGLEKDSLDLGLTLAQQMGLRQDPNSLIVMALGTVTEGGVGIKCGDNG
jgi:hypothetical protein